MSAQNIPRRISRRALIPTFALMTIAPLLSCSTDGDPISDVDEFARFDAIVVFHNVQTIFWNGTQYARGGSVHLTVPDAGEKPPCCLVREGSDRQKVISVLPGETWFIRAYHLDPSQTPDFQHYSQTRCRVTATGPAGLQAKPFLSVRFDSAGLDQMVCSEGWENF